MPASDVQPAASAALSRRRARASWLVVLVAAFAIVVASRAGAQDARRLTVIVPGEITMGAVMPVAIEGARPGQRLRVQIGQYIEPPVNCCVSALYPSIDAAAFTADPVHGRRRRSRLLSSGQSGSPLLAEAISGPYDPPHPH